MSALVANNKVFVNNAEGGGGCRANARSIFSLREETKEISPGSNCWFLSGDKILERVVKESARS